MKANDSVSVPVDCLLETILTLNLEFWHIEGVRGNYSAVCNDGRIHYYLVKHNVNIILLDNNNTFKCMLCIQNVT